MEEEDEHHRGDAEEGDDTDVTGETQGGTHRRRSSGSPHFFPYDPIPSSAIPPAPPSTYSGHSRSSNAGSREPTPRIGMLNLLPEGRAGQTSNARRMFSGSSTSTVTPSGTAKSSHPAQRVFEGISPLDKGEHAEGGGEVDERTPLVGQGQHVTYSSSPESHFLRETPGDSGVSRRRTSVVQLMGDAVERRESMAGGRRPSPGRRKSGVYRGESTNGQTVRAIHDARGGETDGSCSMPWRCCLGSASCPYHLRSHMRAGLEGR